MNGRSPSTAALAALFAAFAINAAQGPLESLVKAERDFARHSVDKGMRAAFEAAFADDGIWFTPHPAKLKETAAKLPAMPQKFTLDWWPTASDVSAAGDLGWNTGPYIFREPAGEKKELERGFFFTLWKRQAGGAWKVALDFGSSDLDPAATLQGPDAWRPARAARYAPKGEIVAEREIETLRAREKELAADAARRGLSAAYARNVAADFRVYRRASLPCTEPAALARLLDSEAALGTLAWEASGVTVARSADLGYTWGSYARTGAGAEEKGYYVHVWRRTASGLWELQVELLRPLAPAKG